MMQGMILAAGMGKRLGKYTKDCTKCMVEVAGKKLIDRAITALSKAGIYKIIVVLGYRGEILKEYLTSNYSQIEFIFVENKDYAETNNIYSLFLAKDRLKEDDTILIESDLIFEDNIIDEIVKYPYENAVAVAKYEQWMDGTVTLLDRNKNVAEFKEKADFRFSEVENYYKTVNIYKFSKHFIENQYIPFLEAYIKAYGKNQYYEMVLKILAHIESSQLKAFIMDNYNWYEIDDVQDLQIASAIFAEEDKQFDAYNEQFGGFWRFPKLKDFCYLVNPYYPPAKMLDHMKYFYDTLLREYPSGLEIQNLNASRMLEIEKDYVLTGNGAAELIHVTGRLLKGKLLIQTPVFNEYIRCFPNCELIKVESEKYQYQISIETILDKIDLVDTVILVNPDNPSGSFITYKDMITLLETCKKKNKKCIIDESFVDFAKEELYYTLLDDKTLEKYPNLIVIKSISKSYGVPGLRLGVLATSDIEYIKILKNNMPIWNVNSFAEYFLQIHNLYKKDYRNACRKIVEEREYLENMLEDNPLLKVYPSQANYIMCELKGKMNAKELANILVKKYNLLIKDLSGKEGVEGDKYIRVAVKSREDNDILVECINQVLV